jgi:hypothetical protein
MRLFRYLKEKSNKFKRRNKKQNFYEIDDTVFTLFIERENRKKGFLDIYEIVDNLYKNLERKRDNKMEKVYLKGVLYYLEYLIKDDVEKLNNSIENFSDFIKNFDKTYHAHYFLGKAFYHKSFSSSDPLKYQSLSIYHLTKSEKKDVEKLIKKNNNKK